MNRTEIINKLIERNGSKCAVCSKQMSGKNICLDHIVPRTLGGDDEIDNLRLVCSDCNARVANTFVAYEAELYMGKLLSVSDHFRNVKTDSKAVDYSVDILAERLEGGHWQSLAIEVKVGEAATTHRIMSIIEQKNRVITQFNERKQNFKFVLAIFARLSEKAMQLLIDNGIEVWDAEYIHKNFAREIEQIPNETITTLLEKLMLPIRKIEQIYIKRLKDCLKGKPSWSEYQQLVGEILSYLFCPPLSSPLKEKSDLSKVNRRDFIFPNYCDNGFWAFLRINYHADYIVVDAKNYESSIDKKAILQIANYLKNYGTGLFGIIVSRKGYSASAQYTVREVWATDRKLILNLQDNDLEQMLLEKMSDRAPENVIQQKIEDFRLSF